MTSAVFLDARRVGTDVRSRVQLSLEPIGGSRSNQGGAGFDVVWTYNVLGLPAGHEAHIQNLDYPRTLWSIQRFRNGVEEGGPTGNYQNAEDALAKLQEEYK